MNYTRISVHELSGFSNSFFCVYKFPNSHQIYQNSVIPSKMEANIQVNDNLQRAWKFFSPVSLSCMKFSELAEKTTKTTGVWQTLYAFLLLAFFVVCTSDLRRQKNSQFFTLDAPLSFVSQYIMVHT